MIASALPLIVAAATIGNWSGVLVADPSAHTCRRVPVPGALHQTLVLAGDRVAFQAGKYTLRIGEVGGSYRTIRSATRVGDIAPADSGFAYVSGATVHVVGGPAIWPRLPRGAVIVQLAFHESDLAVAASWGNGRAGTLRTALFVVSNGVTRRVEDEPDPYGEEPTPVWSPDGSRIAIVRGGDVWTIAPDGSDPVQVTHTPKATEGGVVWSPDSTQLAYWTTRHGVIETYVAPALGGRELRLTHTKPGPRGLPKAAALPGAWYGGRIAVTTPTGLATVDATGGPLETLCRLARGASTYLGPVTWGS
jgi:hypothetical protein